MSNLRIGAALLLALSASPAAAAVGLVTNGGFEIGSFTGWAQSGALAFTSVNTASANTGTYGASFSPNRAGSITQTLTTVPGASYTIRFDLLHVLAIATPLNAFDATFDGVTLLSLSDVGALPYTTYSFTSVATGPATILSFTFRDTRATVFRLDNVSVSTAPVVTVPEPATWALMIGGFGLVGGALRRRRFARA